MTSFRKKASAQSLGQIRATDVLALQQPAHNSALQIALEPKGLQLYAARRVRWTHSSEHF